MLPIVWALACSFWNTKSHRLSVLLVLLVAAGCGSHESPTSPTPNVAPAALFSLQGDPESPQGATWTYRGDFEGVTYDLQGILFKPAGAGPFPAVIISHGVAGNATGYSMGIATEMVRWGLVSIATNYTHAGGVPLGAPGSFADAGGSRSNVLRAHAVREILRRLGYVDLRRLAAHGHSAGAFVTSVLLSTYPSDFRVASHTAGGSRPDALADGISPSDSQVRAIRAPYQLHHAELDFLVPVASEQRLADTLRAVGVPTELYVYSGAQHNDVSRDATMFSRVRAWYTAHGLF
jgi:dienelactone hydrolase